LPKALTLRYVPAVATVTAVPVLWVLRTTRPIVWLMNGMANLVTKPLGLGGVDEMEKEWHTAEEIKLITSEAAEQGALTPRQRSLILNSLALNARTVRQIMVPRVRVAWLDLRKSMDENRRVMNEHLYSHLPLCDGSLDRVVGVVHTKEFLAAYHAAGDTTCLQLLASAPHFVPDTLRADHLLSAFADHQTEFLFLADEYGGVEGIVTLADVVDELVGGRGDAGTGDKRPLTSDQ
jgi:CBS domain containing-hemolysin-like protein